MNLSTLFNEAVSQKASDIHLSTGEVPCLRIDGKLIRMDQPVLDYEAFVSLLEPVLSSESWAKIRSGIPLKRAMSVGDSNFSMIAFCAAGTEFVATFRILSSQVQSIDKIGEGAEPLVELIKASPKGLFLITGPMGSGKVTTASSIVDMLNATREVRVFVVNGSPNYTFASKKGFVTQIYVGQDFDTYEAALEATLHSDPDIIAVDDIPTAEALRQIVMLAESGSVVIANLHADSVADALKKIFEAARGDAVALRRALAQNLVAISCQILFRRADAPGRVPAYEWLTATTDVKNAILHGAMDRVAHLQSTEPESRSLKTALDHLIASGKITEESAAPFRRE